LTTLANDSPSVTTDAPEPEPEFDVDVARLMAAQLLGRGDTAQDVRDYASGEPEHAYMWDAVANAMDAITAVPAPRVTADPSEWDLDPETERHVARLYLTRLTPARLRELIAAGRCEPEFRPMFAGIADAMDALLDGGFDPAASAEEIRAETPAAA
jgi:hypothetical protein